jgi:Leucine-rich repeat (LRR) protein
MPDRELILGNIRLQKQKWLTLFFGVMSLSATTELVTPAFGAPTKKTANATLATGPLTTAGESQKVTVHFPAKSVGKIFAASFSGKWIIYENGQNGQPTQARGDVQLPTQQPVAIILNYDGAANASFLDSPEMAAINLVQMDMKNVESANDDTLKYISHLSKIRRLLIAGTDVTDEGLKYVASNQNLTHLVAGGTLIKGPGLSKLANLPELVSLELPRSNFKNFKFGRLPDFKKLEKLTVAQSLLDDDVCTFVSRQRLIQELDISKNKITDAGIAQLVNLKKLRSINLCQTSITPKCLSSLSKMASLRELALIPGQLPPDSVANMRRTIPRCHIDLRPPDSKVDSTLFAPLR